MTYRKLIEIVERNRLTIDAERLTTGRNHVGFFTFEIIGPVDRLKIARDEILTAWPIPRNVQKDFVTIRPDDIDGTPYLLVDSFYDDSRPDPPPSINGATCKPAPYGSAVWLQLPDPRPITGGCQCKYCKEHPKLTPCWDTLSIPTDIGERTNARAHTIHAPEFWNPGPCVDGLKIQKAIKAR